MAVAARLRRRGAGAPVRAQRCGAWGPAGRGRPGARPPQRRARRTQGARGPAPAGALNLLIDQAWQAVHGPHCKAALGAAVRRLDATVPEFYRLPLGTALVLAAAFRASRAWYARAGPRVEKRVLDAMGAQDTDGLEVAFADSCLGQGEPERGAALCLTTRWRQLTGTRVAPPGSVGAARAALRGGDPGAEDDHLWLERSHLQGEASSATLSRSGMHHLFFPVWPGCLER